MNRYNLDLNLDLSLLIYLIDILSFKKLYRVWVKFNFLPFVCKKNSFGLQRSCAFEFIRDFMGVILDWVNIGIKPKFKIIDFVILKHYPCCIFSCRLIPVSICTQFLSLIGPPVMYKHYREWRYRNIFLEVSSSVLVQEYIIL